MEFPNSIDGYEKCGKLGEGGFGTVYKAKCVVQGKCQEVAIKEINRRTLRRKGIDESGVHRGELLNHWQLEHKNIVKLHNLFHDDHDIYLVLEYCSNGDLQQYTRTKKGLPEFEARKYFRQIVEALHYMHHYNRMHRDLSLQNVLLTKEMDAKLADFGLSVKLGSPDDMLKTMCGTPSYMAPEVARNDPYGMAADNWSLGVMLYALLFGESPFYCAETKDTLRRVRSCGYQFPCHEKNLGDAKDLIQSLIVEDPKARLSLDGVLAHRFLNPSTAEASVDSGHYSTMSAKSRYSALRSSHPMRVLPRSGDKSGAEAALYVSTHQNEALLSQPALTALQRHPHSPPVRDTNVHRPRELQNATDLSTHSNAARHLQYNPPYPDTAAAYRHPPSPQTETRPFQYHVNSEQSATQRFAPSPPVNEHSQRSFRQGRERQTSGSFHHCKPTISEQEPQPTRVHSRLNTAEGTTDRPSVWGQQAMKFYDAKSSSSAERSGRTSAALVQSSDRSSRPSPVLTDSNSERSRTQGQGHQGHGVRRKASETSSVSSHLTKSDSIYRSAELDVSLENERSRTRREVLDNNVPPRSQSGHRQASVGLRSASAKELSKSAPNLQAAQRAADGPVVELGVDNRVSRSHHSVREGIHASPLVQLNTKRLQPIRRENKRAVVHIFDTGQLCMEVKCTKNPKMARNVFIVSADGQEMMRYIPNGGKRYRIGDAPPPMRPGDPRDFSTFPDVLSVGKYRLMADYVTTLKEQTPKFTRFTDDARCKLFEHGNFEAKFNDGVVVTFTPDASQIEVKEKNGASHQLSENTVANLAPNLYEFYSKAKQFRGWCVEDAELLEHMESINQRRPGKRVSYFPAVFHDNRCARLGNLSKSSTAAAVGRERKEEAAASRREEPGRSPTSVASLSPLAPSCVTVASFAGTMVSEATTRSRPTPLAEPRSEGRSHSSTRREREHRPSAPHGGARRSKSATSQHRARLPENCSFSSSRSEARRFKIPGLAQVIEYPNGNMRMDFPDSSSLTIQLEPYLVQFTDQHGREERYRTSTELPRHIKEIMQKYRTMVS